MISLIRSNKDLVLVKLSVSFVKSSKNMVNYSKIPSRMFKSIITSAMAFRLKMSIIMGVTLVL